MQGGDQSKNGAGEDKQGTTHASPGGLLSELREANESVMAG